MVDWFKANLLTINLGKTECHNINCSNPHALEMELGNHTIRNSDQVKFLGIWIDKNLQWSMHTNTLLMKLKQNTNLLNTGNKFLNKASKKLVYYAHINSHITYGILVWENMIDKETKKKIQKCMDACFNLIIHLPPTPLNYKKEKMLRLEKLLLLENTKLSYKVQHSLLPTKLHSILLSDSKKKILIKNINMQLGLKIFLNYPQPKLKNTTLASYSKVSKTMKIYL